jgi:hypothetical protein
MNKVKQKRYVDDNEGTGVNRFIEGVIEKYHLRDFYPEVEYRTRSVNYDLMPDHVTDDHISQLVVDNRLVALVFCRRDDWNHTEVTTVFLDDVLKKCRKHKDKINQRIKNRFESYRK